MTRFWPTGLEHLNVKLLRADGTLRDATITIDHEGPFDRLTLSEPMSEPALFQGHDLFDALIELRRMLEQRGDRLLCAGARKDVWPSSMGRSMGAGRKSYIMRMGQQGRREDLVDIFAEASPDDIGTVDEQKAFREAWISQFLRRDPMS